jgi:ribosomal protein S14
VRNGENMEVIKGDDGRYYKNCPCCGKPQSYLRKNYAKFSLENGKLCKACTNKNPEHNAHKGYYKDVLRKSFAHKYKSNAELRGIQWGVSFDYLADLLISQDFKCALTGWDIHAMDINSPASLDRIDSSLGYIEGNLQWVYNKVNMMKQHYTQEDFIAVCRAVVETIKE